MRRTPIALLTTAACAILALPAISSATPEVGQKDNGFSICDERYLKLYAEAHDAGIDVGRNRVDDGKLLKSGEVVPEPHPCALADRLDAALNPPEPTVASSISSDVAPSAPVTTTVAPSAAAPSVVQCESGGDYAANTGNGYYGGYQFDSGTWDAYGDSAYGEANEAPPAVQDAAAASVPYDAWPNC